MRNIKDVRIELSRWGNFWVSKEYGSGFSKRSPTDRLNETMELGYVIPSDMHLFNNKSDAITVPEQFASLGVAIDQLSIECRRAIRQKYISKTKITNRDQLRSFKYWICKAESALL